MLIRYYYPGLQRASVMNRISFAHLVGEKERDGIAPLQTLPEIALDPFVTGQGRPGPSLPFGKARVYSRPWLNSLLLAKGK